MAGNIAKPRSGNVSKVVAMVVGVGIIAIAGTLAFFLYLDLRPKQTETETETVSNEVDSSFYSFTEKREDLFLLPSETPNESAPDDVAQNDVVNPSLEGQKTLVIGRGDTNAANSQPARVTNANEAFVKERQPTRDELIAMRRAQINASRRAVSPYRKTPHFEQLKESEAEQETLPAPKDKDFSAQEIGKDESTYPVDLERTITADRYIDCVLQDQINSQLEGRAVCQIEKNIFGYHGRKILIPAGSKAIGSHGTLKKVGDERFNIKWTRILRPDGVNIKITDGYTADRVGASGIEGVVNNRNWEKYGGALLTSTISALAQISIPTENTIQNQVIQSYGTDIGQVTAAMLNENINIKPYSIVPSGTRIKIIPTTDIWLKDVGNTSMFVQKEQ